MRPIETSAPLPPLRKKVFRHSLLIVGLYAFVGVFMMIAVYLASGTTPRAIHLNYDSISASTQMNHALNGIKNPDQHPEQSVSDWTHDFENSLHFEDTNISEPGEAQIVKNIHLVWDRIKTNPGHISQTDYSALGNSLDQLINVNEKGMFALATESNHFSRQVFIASILLFLGTVAIALYLADGLTIRIATPLRELSVALRRKPEPGSKLKVPQPTTLEMRILTHELTGLWQRVSDLQKLNLEEITSQRNKLETVLASVDDAILVLDNQEHVIHSNDGMIKLLGFSSEEMLDKPWRDLSSMSSNYLKLRDHLNTSITSDKLIELLVNGQMRIFSGRVRNIFDQRGQQIGTLYLLHDITDIKQKDRLKTEFIGVLSHELKTPLQSLGTASELLLTKKGQLDDDGRMLIETVHEDVGRIRGVANEFIQVGLIDLHSLRLKIEPVPINQMIQRWIQPFQVLAKDRNVKLKFINQGSESIMARVDTVKFPWAIANLLSNAIRVSPPDSTVTVFVSDREKKVDIEVRDEGPGIPASVQEHMFDPYFQGGQIGENKTSGFLGLGLTITKEVVEAHDGQIEYFRRDPKGSVFRINLPLFM